MSFPTGVYILRASPVIGVDGLYATGNGDNEIVTVEPNTPPFVEHQTVSTRHLHVFWMIKAVNALLLILFSGTSNWSIPRKANTSSPASPLEDIGARRTKNLLPMALSLLRKRLTNGTFHIITFRTFPTPSRTYMSYSNISSQHASPPILQHSRHQISSPRDVVRWNEG